MIVILDAGHGKETPGKRSPDGKLREYKYCREIQAGVKKELQDLGYQVECIVEDDSNPSLSKRCSFVNNLCKLYGKDNCLLVSIHNNAAGSGKEWLNAKGWSVFISENASYKSKQLADCLFDAAEVEDLKIRKQKPHVKYWKANLAMCRDTNCAAVLTENLFLDNKDDVAFLLSELGKQSIINLHVNGIVNYVKNI